MPRVGPEFGRVEQYGLWFCAWFFAFLYLILSYGFGGAIGGFIFFPCGLAPRVQWRPDAARLLMWVGGWVFYAFLSVVALRTRRGMIYFALLGALVILLVINIAGLRVLVEKWSREPFAL